MTTDLDFLPWSTPNADPAPTAPPIPAEDPLVIQVTRYQCPHCRQSRSKKTAAIAHIGRCWKNPAVRTCKTCEHYLPAYPVETCNPGQGCGCGDLPEACDVGNEIPADQPASHCPKWELRREEWPC
ncbi:hypothetical protein ACFY8X_38595 [Streptomyces tanashiensis]|uniref:hypothetical protein n=1 Tax=Streptomyces tanashiensis TaxID=67367 RepID=UPI0036E01A58